MKEYKSECLWAVVCVAVTSWVNYAFMPNPQSEWYLSLVKPSYSPPNYLFGPVWTTLYIMMGVGLGRMLKDVVKNRELIAIFALQALFNLSWTPLFFVLRRIDLALANLTVLTLLVFLFVYKAKDPVLRWLFTPYLLWLCYALSLNAGIFYLN